MCRSHAKVHPTAKRRSTEVAWAGARPSRRAEPPPPAVPERARAHAAAMRGGPAAEQPRSGRRRVWWLAVLLRVQACRSNAAGRNQAPAMRVRLRTARASHSLHKRQVQRVAPQLRESCPAGALVRQRQHECRKQGGWRGLQGRGLRGCRCGGESKQRDQHQPTQPRTTRGRHAAASGPPTAGGDGL